MISWIFSTIWNLFKLALLVLVVFVGYSIYTTGQEQGFGEEFDKWYNATPVE